ncbi:MAG: plastocyanin/azurin family copper-binding protein [Candidatus Paceibacterota bacterium]
MKYVLGVLVVALLIAGGWYLANDVEAPVTDPMDESTETEMSDMDDENTISGSVVEIESSVVVDSDPVVIDISGHNFAFDQDEIRVQEGDTVVINFTSTDGFHDWVVDEFDAATERVSAGNSSSVTFVADSAGTYEFYCSVGTHRQQGMVGTLIVE